MDETPTLTRRQAIGAALATGLGLALPRLAGADAPAREAAPALPLSAAPPGARRVIVDTDPGNDDALAILLALDAPSLHVEAITVCPGNLGPDYDQQVRNALYVVDVAGRSGQVPVHAGMARPILNRPYPIATFIHGRFGLGRVAVPAVPQSVASEHAVDVIRRIVNGSPGEVTIAALGGLTNIAMAILRDPAVARNVKEIVFVGGKYQGPGVVPSYNVLVDPEAAHVVLTSGAPVTMVGNDVIRRDSIMTDADFAHAASFNTRRSRFFIESNDLRRTFEKGHRGTTGSTNPDPLAMATLIEPGLASAYMPLYMHVELEGTSTRGLLVYGDNLYTQAPTPPPNVRICLQCDGDRFRAMVFRTLARA